MKQIIKPCQLRTRLAQLGMPPDNDFYATKNFSWQELLVNQSDLPSLEVLNNLLKIAVILQKYRNTVFENSAITITSGWRSSEYNRKIGGAADSFHIKGMALDFVVAGFSPRQVQLLLDPVHKGGLEFAPTWTHIDIRGQKIRFKYKGS